MKQMEFSASTKWLLIFAAVGLVLGAALSFVFGAFSKKGMTSYSRLLFGHDSNSLITDLIVLLVAASVIFLAVVSGLVRDIDYARKNPSRFAIETVLMAVLPSLVFFAMTIFRGYSITWERIMEFSILCLKFGLIHVLLQFSGFYSSVFPPMGTA